MLITKRTLLPLLLGTLAVTAPASGDDWPRWRGPGGTQISNEKGWNPQALFRPRVLWESQIGKGHSAFAVKDGLVFTLGNRKVAMDADTFSEEIVFCLDATTGAERWRYAYPATQGDTYAGPSATPYVGGEKVYTMGRNGELLCLDAATGRLLWRRQVIDEGLTTTDAWGVTGSPVLEGDLLLLNIGTAGAALNSTTGEVVWASEPGMCGFASPVVFTHQGRRLAAMQGKETLHIVEVKTGKEIWSYPWNSYQDAVVLGDLLLLTGGRENKGNGSAMVAWTEEEPRVVWKHKRAEAAFQGWVVIDGHAYGFQRARRQTFRCVNLDTGEINWEQDLGDWGSFTAADGRLLVVTGEGEMLIAKASPDGFQVDVRARVIEPVDHGEVTHGERCFVWTHPVLANGLLYVRNSDGDLVCVDLRGEADVAQSPPASEPPSGMQVSSLPHPGHRLAEREMGQRPRGRRVL